MVTGSQINSRNALIGAVLANNLGGAIEALKNHGFLLNGNESEATMFKILTARSLVNRTEANRIANILSHVIYVNDNPNWTGGNAPVNAGAAARGDWQDSEWGDIVGALGLTIAGIFGATAAQPTSSGSVDNSSLILGMEKTMFYGMAALGLLIITIIVVIAIRKK